MTEGPGPHLGTVGALSLSVISSVAIVICNKALISTLGFCFGKALAYPLCHALYLAISLRLLLLLLPFLLSFQER